MTGTQYLLVCLMEECAEVSERASKCLRFTAEEVQPGQPLPNERRLADELTDLFTVVEVLRRGRLKMPTFCDARMMEEKRAKLERFFGYSRELGIIE